MAVLSLGVAVSSARVRIALLGAVLLSSCTSGTEMDAQNRPRRALATAEEPVLMTVVGNPFAMDEARLNALISSELADGVSGMTTRFTTSPERAAASDPRVVVVLNPLNEPAPAALCVAPEAITTAPASEQVRILAAFCQGDQVLGAARTEDVVGGPTDQRFRRLLWRTSSALFPDDYAETYGFGILPRWVDFGLGGSIGE